MKKYNYTLLIFTFLLVVSSCSNKKNTTMSRAFHNVTARYNVYFNAKESFKKGILKAEKKANYNYADFLPIYLFENPESQSLLTSDMNRAIKKCNILISKHSITSKPKNFDKQKLKNKDLVRQTEYCKWVDDAHLLMGKAHLYKGENEMAVKLFILTKNQYFYLDVKYDAELWLIKAYLNSNRLDEAFVGLEALRKSNKTPEKIKLELSAAYADYYIKSKKIKEAIPYIIKAIDESKKRSERERLNYILAQAYQNTNQFELARNQYTKVIKMNPVYEMTFNAKVNLATSFNNSSNNSEDLKKTMLKMLNDNKNIDFKDHIYFALAEIEKKSGNKKQALEYYTLSTRSEGKNNTIKTKSYLSMAHLNLDTKNYLDAAFFFDSTLLFIQPDFPKYGEVSSQTKDYSLLSKNLHIVNYQDSLMHLSLKPKVEIDNIISGIIAQIIQDEKDKEAALLSMQGSSSNNRLNMNQQQSLNTGEAGKWYFYNQSAISFGRNEFKMKWGTRKLEDNWRRFNKKMGDSSLASDEESEEENTEVDLSSIIPKGDKKSKDYYLSQIPFSDSAKLQSKAKIEKALFETGKIYKDNLHDFNKSMEAFESHINRFKTSPARPDALFYAYQAADSISNNEKQNYYKQILLSEYPTSKYAQYLRDPNYLQKIKSKENEIELFYQQTYNQYITANYSAVLGFCDYADENYKDHKVYPKFELLRTLVYGKQMNETFFKEKLIELSKKYETNEVGQKAAEILTFLEQKQMMIQTGKTTSTIETQTSSTGSTDMFSLVPSEEHYISVVYDTVAVDKNQLKFEIINFNVDNYIDKNYKISKENLFQNIDIYIISGFKDIEESKGYYNKLKNESDSVFVKTGKNNVQYFIISVSNLETLTQQKNLKDYIDFFNKQY